MAKKITDMVSWVGKIDWELKHFHGDELSTEKGSSYNAYLIQDEKTVLIDTVWKPYDDEFVANLKKVIDLKKIDYIVMNHNEIDHSGALPEILRKIPALLYTARRKARLYFADTIIRTGTTLTSRPATN